MPQPTRKRPVALSAPIREYADRHPGARVWLKDLVELTGGAPTGIQTVMGKLVGEGQAQVVTRGNCWQIGKAQQSGGLFEQIGTTKNGDLVVQDEDGRLFVAREVN